jgi:hypothetical protein
MVRYQVKGPQLTGVIIGLSDNVEFGGTGLVHVIGTNTSYRIRHRHEALGDWFKLKFTEYCPAGID